MEHWLKTRNLKVPPNSTNLRLSALKKVMQSSSCGKEDEAKTVQKFVAVLPSFASRSAKHQEILNNCVDLLGFLLQKDGTGKFPLGCLRMLTNISKEDVRLQVSKMLWARLQQLRSGEGI